MQVTPPSHNLSLVSYPRYTSFTDILLASLSKPLEVIFGGWVGSCCVAQVNFSFSALLSLPSQTCTTLQGRALEVQSGSTRQKALASLTVKPSRILSETYPFHIPKVFKHLSGWAVGQTGVKQNTKQTHTLPFHGP